MFPGFPGVATAVLLFALIWLTVYLKCKGRPVVFDTSRPKPRRVWQEVSVFLDITKSILGLAAGSIVLLVGAHELQPVKYPIPEGVCVAVVSGGDEHHLRSAFHDLAGLELRASSASSE